jgi:formamidopyrimidine-DNA glycosylase
MPELPELEVFKKYTQSTSLHQEIIDVEIYEPKLLGNINQKALQKKLIGQRFETASRYGKYLCLELTDDNWFILHFGMSGSLKYYQLGQEKPEYTKLLIIFKEEAYLSYKNIRKLGEINYSKTIDSFVDEKGLGPDFLELTRDEFREIVQNRRGTIKYTLMQQNIMAGIGNEYSDEVLFQTEIHPETSANELTAKQCDLIFDELNGIITIAVDRNGNESKYPDTFLIPHREKNGKCPICGDPLKRIKVSGRSAYICLNRQKNPD